MSASPSAFRVGDRRAPPQPTRWRAEMAVFTSDGEVWAIRPSDHPTIWVLPGGGVDPGEPPEAAARREAEEEAGLSVDTLAFLGVVATPFSMTYVYLGRLAGPPMPPTHGSEIDEVRPVPITSLIPSVQDFLRRRLASLLTTEALESEAEWDETKYRRHPKGSARGGQFAPKGGAVDVARPAEPEPEPAEPAARAAPRGLPERGDIPGGPGELAAPRGAPDPYAPRLDGLPATATIPGRGSVAVGPFPTARQTAIDYMAAAGLPYDPPRQYVKVDPERAARIAAAYDAMPHAPQDPQVKAAYRAMIDETLAQYQFVKRTGLTIEAIDYAKQGDPYAASPRLALQDVIEHNHLWFFPTESGFGSDETFDARDNPLLEPTDEYLADGRRLLANDVFRIVHDYFGHLKEGNGFRADGEENAWRQHSAMYSPLARQAMTSETRGQNSWVNYGPHGEQNRSASSAETVFADQKTGILPEWVVDEGARDELVLHGPRRDVLPDDVVSVFTDLGQLQRAEPEQAMLRVQHRLGGGVLSGVVEHVGDLTHRMSHMAKWGNAGREYVLNKTEKTLHWLTNPYGFEREHRGNILSNARYRGEDPQQLSQDLDALLDDYARAHMQLPVYNQPQWLARDAAVAVGEQHWSRAVERLQVLHDLAQKGEDAWRGAAFHVQRDSSNRIVEYAPPPSGWLQASPEEFIERRNRSTRLAYMAPLSPSDVTDHRLRTNAEGTVGYAIDRDGDIQNVFNNGGPKGAGIGAMFAALDEGGYTLDCYDPFLPKFYSQFGFVETGRMKFVPEYAPPGWNFDRDGQPDVVFMAWKGYPDDRVALRERIQRNEWRPHERSERYYTDWDAAKADARGAGRPRSRRQESRESLRGTLRAPDPGAGPRDRPHRVAYWDGPRPPLIPVPGLGHVPDDVYDVLMEARAPARPDRQRRFGPRVAAFFPRLTSLRFPAPGPGEVYVLTILDDANADRLLSHQDAFVDSWICGRDLDALLLQRRGQAGALGERSRVAVGLVHARADLGRPLRACVMQVLASTDISPADLVAVFALDGRSLWPPA